MKDMKKLLITIGIILFSMQLTGCGNYKGKEAVTYISSSVTLDLNFDLINSVQLKNDFLYYYGIRYESEIYSGEIYRYNINTEKNYVVPILLDSKYQMQDFYVDNENNIYLLVCEKGEELTEWNILQYSVEGTFTDSIALSDLQLQEIAYWFVTEKDIWFVDMNNSIVKVSKNGEKQIWRKQYDNIILSCVYDEYLDLLVYSYNIKKNKYEIVKISDENALETLLCDDEEILKNNTKIQCNINHNIIINGNLGCYELENKQPEILFEWLELGIDNTNVRYVGEDEKEGYVFLNSALNEEGKFNEIIFIKQGNRSDESREIIELATVNLGQELKKQVVEFNKTNQNYRIHVKEYGGEGCSDIGFQKLYQELLSLNKIDIIEMDTEKLFLLEGKNMLEDLYPYMTREGYRDNMIASILNTYDVNGKLYGLMYKFEIDTVLCKKSVMKPTEPFTITKLMQIRSEFPNEKLFSTDEKRVVLYNCLLLNIDRFVGKGTANFDDSEFGKLIQLANESNVDLKEEAMEKSLLVNAYLDQSFDIWLEIYRTLMNEDINIIGYPTDTTGKSAFSVPTFWGIMAASEKKKGAWEFVSSFLEEDYQYAIEDLFPVNCMAFEKILNEKQKVDYVVDNGKMTEKKLEISYCIGENFYNIVVDALTQEEASQIREIVNSIQDISYIDKNLINIIDEETQGYYLNQKSLEDTVSTIQARSRQLINE